MARGSPSGERRGGRAKGTPNKATAAKAAEIAASGETPLDYMLGVMWDTSAPVERRDEMAKAAAPFVHPRFSALTAYVESDQRHSIVSPVPLSEEEWAAEHAASIAG